MGLTIRACEVGDLPSVRELMAQLSEVADADEEFDLALMEEIFQAMAQVPEVYLNLVAIVDGRVAGFLSLIFYKTFFHRGGTALINELVVSRELRGQGIGQALVQRAREAAVARGMDEVEVGTEPDNAIARQFYRRCGFDEEYLLLGMELGQTQGQ